MIYSREEAEMSFTVALYCPTAVGMMMRVPEGRVPEGCPSRNCKVIPCDLKVVAGESGHQFWECPEGNRVGRQLEPTTKGHFQFIKGGAVK